MSELRIRALTAFYGDFQALFGIDIDVAAGEVVAIIGANGAGKSTSLRSIAGLLRNDAEGILWDGRAIGALPANEVVRLGIALVPEGRRLFPSLSVEENLRIGGYAGRTGEWTLERVLELFPVLAERRNAPGTALSGGQQQMVAIGRALLSNPQLLLCDEISLGLSPAVIIDLYRTLATVNAGGTTLVLVEQDIQQAMSVADRVYCLQEGQVTLSGPPKALTHEAIREAYFGL
ncbi:MAG TPA: ABC transporter ATP-binding protein [Alphaproteobacteria bacterium]|nr:ABC transporter ATP-binding protein [Alphaproteobacteria bacterium]